MKNLASLALLGTLGVLAGCFPVIDMNGPDDSDYYNGFQRGDDPMALNESVISMRNLPYAGGTFSEVFHPMGIKNYVEALKAGETPPAIFPEDGGCSYGNLMGTEETGYQLSYHLCAEGLKYSNTQVNGHMGGFYEERPDGTFNLVIDFVCLGTDDWTLFGSETITGKWEDEAVARYDVVYNVEVQDNDCGYFYFKGTDVQTFDGELFTVKAANYSIGDSYNNDDNSKLVVEQPLVFKQGCVEDPGVLNLFSAGIEEETFRNNAYSLNYGDGTCDDQTTVSGADEVRTVSVREVLARQ